MSDENQIGQKYSGINIKWDIESGKHLLGQTASGKTMSQKKWEKHHVGQRQSCTNTKCNKHKVEKHQVQQTPSRTNIMRNKHQVAQTLNGTNIRWDKHKV